MYNNLFNVLDYVNCAMAKKTIISHLGNFEHSQTIMRLTCHVMTLNRLKIWKIQRSDWTKYKSWTL